MGRIGMGRELKFRCWHTAAEQMLYEDDPGDSFRWKREGQPLEIMQYTGFKDRVGIEIYEGDICEHKPIMTEKRTIGAVTIRPTQGVMIGNMPLFMDPEVIGNIYENPELLEV